ncbi:MAG: hypothetical protein KBE04_09965 [Phycisphaerae bacterium]|nr:hypothetical protein [Phycisphaerae bacterium]
MEILYDRPDPEGPCHGTLECLRAGSGQWILGRAVKLHQKPRSYLGWWIENLGWREGLLRAWTAQLRRSGPLRARPRCSDGADGAAAEGECLGLQPGELVQVKTIEEVLATLDVRRRNKGLLWMTGMRRYCGTRHRVGRRVEKIMLETSGQVRRMKNTVLLEGVTCDGAHFGGCDRSCFHFWREVWLRRVEDPQPE